MIAITAALAAAATPAPDLSWMSGYWLSCEGGFEISETWTDVRQSSLTGMTTTLGYAVPFDEFLRIHTAGGRTLLMFQPGGGPAIRMDLKAEGPRTAAFQKAEPDYPARISYRREGDVLIRTIEGDDDGEARLDTRRLTLAPLNTRCR